MAAEDPHAIATRAVQDKDHGNTTTMVKDVIPELSIAEMANQQPTVSTTMNRAQKPPSQRTVAREEVADYETINKSTVPAVAAAAPPPEGGAR